MGRLPKLPWSYRWPLYPFWRGYLAWKVTRLSVPVWQKTVKVTPLLPNRQFEEGMLWALHAALYAKRNYRRSAWVLTATLVALAWIK